MALIEVSDLPRDFVNYYRNDVEWIAGSATTVLENIGQAGQILHDFVRNFSNHRQKFLEIFCKALDEEVAQKRINIETALPVAVEATTTLMVNSLYDVERQGDNGTIDFINSMFNNNPILRDLPQGGRPDRDTVRQSSVRSNSYGDNQRYPNNNNGNRQGGYPQNQYQQNQPYRQNQYVQQQGGPQNGGTRYKGALNRSEPVVNQPNQNQPQQQQAVEPTPALSDGSVVTSNNVKVLGYTAIKPAYIIGREQVEYIGGKLLIKTFNGRNDVDYDAHRIDRFYTEYMPSAQKSLDLTMSALKEAEKTRDNTIRSYLQEEVEGEMQSSPLPKLFDTTNSFEYDQVVNTQGLDFEPVLVRQDLTKLHGGNFKWWNDNSLKVKCRHSIPLDGVSNDAIIRIKNLLNETVTFELIKQFIELVGYIDTAVWRRLHDYITDRFNIKLLTAGLPFNLDSITAQWSELTEILTEEYASVVGVIGTCNGMLGAIEITEGEDDESPAIVIAMNTIFIPINTFDFDLGVLSPEDPLHILPKDSIMYNTVSKLMESETSLLVTLDGEIIVVEPYTTLTGRDYVIRKA